MITWYDVYCFSQWFNGNVSLENFNNWVVFTK